MYTVLLCAYITEHSSIIKKPLQGEDMCQLSVFYEVLIILIFFVVYYLDRNNKSVMVI